jgi:hypothetical protein
MAKDASEEARRISHDEAMSIASPRQIPERATITG